MTRESLQSAAADSGRTLGDEDALPAIAVLDTGVNAERLSFARTLPGVNFSGDGPGDCANDENGHGTAIAATVLRHAPKARIVPVKLMGKYGYPRIADAIERAFEWIIEHHEVLGIRIICAAMADGSHLTTDEPYRGTVLHRYIEALRSAGVATVIPAGNGFQLHRRWNPQGMAWPAILREVVSVGALALEADNFRLSDASQRLHSELGTGCHTTIFAEPGEPGGVSGAAAVVAGRLGSLAASHPRWTVDGLVNELLDLGLTIEDDEGRPWPMLGRVGLSPTSC